MSIYCDINYKNNTIYKINKLIIHRNCVFTLVQIRNKIYELFVDKYIS
jgi:hypothetical protein